jgi:hypothetical protein
MPAGISKLHRKAKVSRKLDKKFPERLPAVLGRERRWQLNQHHLQLRFEGFNRAEK